MKTTAYNTTYSINERNLTWGKNILDQDNRYAYCLNNPLKYTDPSGYTYIGADRYYSAQQSFHVGYKRSDYDIIGWVGSSTDRFYNYCSEMGIDMIDMLDMSVRASILGGGKIYSALTYEGGHYQNVLYTWYQTSFYDKQGVLNVKATIVPLSKINLENYGSDGNKSDAQSGGGQTQELITNSDVYYGLVGTNWLWSGTAAINAPHFRVDAASRSAGKFVGKMGVGLNWVATAAEGYDLYNNWDQAGTGDVAKFGVDATITVVTTILYISGVGAPVAVILTGIQVANTLGAFDFIYESFNESINNGVNGGGGSW